MWYDGVMNFLHQNQELIRKNYPFDVWASTDQALSIQISSWCAECLKVNRHESGVVIYAGESLCENHFQDRVGENEN